MKKSFSLIELIVVISILAVLMLVVANFLIATIRQNNQATIENEVRNEGNFLMEQIISDVRKSACETMPAPPAIGISLYSTKGCTGTAFAAYSAENGKLYKSVDGGGNTQINSDQVKVRGCAACSSCVAVPTPGVIIKPTIVPNQRTLYDITLNLTQAKDNPRSDFCGKIMINEIVKPRN